MSGPKKRVPFFCQQRGAYVGFVIDESVETLADEVRKLRLRTREGLQKKTVKRTPASPTCIQLPSLEPDVSPNGPHYGAGKKAA
jgi:hypothetical protein